MMDVFTREEGGFRTGPGWKYGTAVLLLVVLGAALSGAHSAAGKHTCCCGHDKCSTRLGDCRVTDCDNFDLEGCSAPTWARVDMHTCDLGRRCHPEGFVCLQQCPTPCTSCP